MARTKTVSSDLTCAPCRRRFAGEKALGKHRQRGRCLDPATVGLVQLRTREQECWGVLNQGAAEEWFGELEQLLLPLRIPRARNTA